MGLNPMLWQLAFPEIWVGISNLFKLSFTFLSSFSWELLFRLAKVIGYIHLEKLSVYILSLSSMKAIFYWGCLQFVSVSVRSHELKFQIWLRYIQWCCENISSTKVFFHWHSVHFVLVRNSVSFFNPWFLASWTHQSASLALRGIQICFYIFHIA